LSEVDPRWYESFFEGEEWLLLATSRDPEQTQREADFCDSHLPEGARVLDVPCGTGRHAALLAERGHELAGLDISNRVLDVARAALPEGDFRQGDMRELPWPDASFEGLINLWTAFGYFETEEENERVMAEFARVLAPGGVLILDTVNQPALLRGFREKSWGELDDTLLLERHEYDQITGRSRAFWTFVRGAARSELSFDHRVYTTPEYVQMMRRNGLEPEGFFGGFDGTDLAWDTWRQIVVARRV
jgi:ubiquinone/menaquinone biosynthesis C-methylase UbiE